MDNPKRTTVARKSPSYRVRGSGPVLIYVAGLDGSGELLFKQLTGLESSYRVVTFRLREDGDFSYDDLVADIDAIIQDLGEPRATILGESFGGTVALSFALGRPDRVERLVVVNSFPRFYGRIRIRLAAWIANKLPFGLIWFARAGFSLLGLMADGVNKEDRRRFFAAIKTVRKGGYARRLALIAEFDIEDHLSKISTPTLFIAGDRDLLIPSVREARKMAAQMPNASVTVVEGAGHACLMGERVDLAEILTRWRKGDGSAQIGVVPERRT